MQLRALALQGLLVLEDLESVPASLFSCMYLAMGVVDTGHQASGFSLRGCRALGGRHLHLHHDRESHFLCFLPVLPHESFFLGDSAALPNLCPHAASFCIRRPLGGNSDAKSSGRSVGPISFGLHISAVAPETNRYLDCRRLSS